jgi:hypothetical protein
VADTKEQRGQTSHDASSGALVDMLERYKTPQTAPLDPRGKYSTQERNSGASTYAHVAFVNAEGEEARFAYANWSGNIYFNETKTVVVLEFFGLLARLVVIEGVRLEKLLLLMTVQHIQEVVISPAHHTLDENNAHISSIAWHWPGRFAFKNKAFVLLDEAKP